MMVIGRVIDVIPGKGVQLRVVVVPTSLNPQTGSSLYLKDLSTLDHVGYLRLNFHTYLLHI